MKNWATFFINHEGIEGHEEEKKFFSFNNFMYFMVRHIAGGVSPLMAFGKPNVNINGNCTIGLKAQYNLAWGNAPGTADAPHLGGLKAQYK